MYIVLKILDVSNMGEAALKSHAKGSKHTKLAKQHSEEKSKAQSRISELWSTATVNVEMESRPVSTAKANPNGELTSFVTKDVLTSEIWWALKMVTSHFSFTSNIGISDLFRRIGISHLFRLIRYGLGKNLRWLVP